MDLPEKVEVYIKELIDDSLGLPVSAQTLELKLRATEDTNRRLNEQHLSLLEKLHQKDVVIEKSRAEASMNALQLKKFIEANQRIAGECESLVNQCAKLERECSLYHKDREALMDFGNEVDERAKEAEARVHKLEEELERLKNELRTYKNERDASEVDSSTTASAAMEESLLEPILSKVIKSEETDSARIFLENYKEDESCQKLLAMWNSMKDSTRKIISLVAKIQMLQKDKEHLRVNLARAEEEVKLLFEENTMLDEANKKLLQKHYKEQHDSSGEKISSSTPRGNKRKSSPKSTSPIERKIDFHDIDLVRPPLSPLRHNSPGCRMHKK